MKFAGKILGIFGLMLMAANAQAQRGVSFGQLTLGGTSCRLGGAGPLNIGIENGMLQIPAASLVRKNASDTLERGSCMFALPVQMAPGYRMVLRDLSAIGDLNLARGTTSRIDMEIFAAGSQGPKITNIDGSPNRRVRKTIQLREEGEILVSECGESFNLRGNTSLLLQGQGALRSTAALHLIEMSVDIEKCQ